jgi:hypothetical protein
MEKNRKILHTILLRDEYVKDTYNDFEAFDTHYFRDAGGVDKIYSTCKKATYKEGKKEGEVIFGKDINRFYELYVCDLSWAKQTTYCGGGNTNTATWDNYPCVVELARTKGVSMNRDKSYKIGDFKYYPNGRKGIISTGGVVKFTCNDPEFKKSGGGGCPSLTSNQKKPENFFKIKYPGDTKYSYGKDTNGTWFAINNDTKIQFNLTVCGYKETTKRLNNITKREDGSQKPELDNVKSAPNDKVNIAWVEPTTEPKPLEGSDKIIDGQMEFMSDTNGL